MDGKSAGTVVLGKNRILWRENVMFAWNSGEEQWERKRMTPGMSFPDMTEGKNDSIGDLGVVAMKRKRAQERWEGKRNERKCSRGQDPIIVRIPCPQATPMIHSGLQAQPRGWRRGTTAQLIHSVPFSCWAASTKHEDSVAHHWGIPGLQRWW